MNRANAAGSSGSTLFLYFVYKIDERVKPFFSMRPAFFGGGSVAPTFAWYNCVIEEGGSRRILPFQIAACDHRSSSKRQPQQGFGAVEEAV